MAEDKKAQIAVPISQIPDIIREQFDLVIALDTEWTADPFVPDPSLGLTLEKLPSWSRDGRNRILSYQLVVVETCHGRQAETILYPDQRLRLSDILLEACHMLDIPDAKLRARGKFSTVLRVCVVWHWGSAEVGALADRKRLMSHTEEVVCIGGGVVSLKPIEYPIDLGGKNYGKVLLTMRDTHRLADEHSPLEALGEAIGIPKVDITPWSKSRMDLLLTEDKPLFEQYALTDSHISLQWLFNVAETNKTVLHLDKIPPTTGSASAEGLKEFLGEDFARRFCVEYKHGHGYQPRQTRAVFEPFPTACYMGGANQSYQLGYVEGTVLDLDLSGAYGAAMGCLPGINWEASPVAGIKDPWQLIDPMCFALVRFRFPKGTLFPCVPVGTDHGLVYALSCQDSDGAAVTGPELHEALRMGADIEVLRSLKFETEGLLLAGYVRYLVEQRRMFPDKADPRNTAAKLAVNSLYGKFGQGLKNRYTNAEIFSDQEIRAGKRMPKSAITLPHAAATITGIVRAVLNAMVLEASKLGIVLSATTDGIMLHMPNIPLTGPIVKGTPPMDPPRALLEACEQHPAVQLLMQGRVNIGEDPAQWLEVKYAGNQAYTVKTRMNWIGWNGETVNQAMVGLDKKTVSFQDLNDVRENKHHRFHTEHSLNKITDVIEGIAADITGYYISREVNLTPDWKRKFAQDGSSVPFESMEEWQHYRRAVNAQGKDAWPDMIELMKDERHVSKSLTAIRREILHRIAFGVEGFRLPKGMSPSLACVMIGVHKNAISKLKQERKGWKPLPQHPEIDRVKAVLGLY